MLEDPHVTVFVPGYNVEKYIARCLDSLLSQTWENTNIAVLNDASTDSTGSIIAEYELANQIGLISFHNHKNLKMPRNLTYLRYGHPNDVIVIVDADDYLPHNRVIATIADYYKDPDLWLMYGSYTRYPDPTHMPNPAKPFPVDVIAQRSFRNYSQIDLVYNHPLTFRRRLLQNIADWELQDDDGNWFTVAYDHTVMMPMLEMATGHFKWCPDILYVYNEENEASEAKGDPSEGIRVHNIVNARVKRDPL
jgi:glycosyltransferase involved in cell wall biosynthesis